MSSSENSSKSDLITQLGELAFASRLRRLSENLMKDVNRVYARCETEFQARWFPVAYLLSRESPLPLTTIARRLHLSHPAVNQIAGDMSRKGLLKSSKDAGDGRRRLLALSEKGRATVDRLKPVWSDIDTETSRMLRSTGHDVLDLVSQIESTFDETDLFGRIMGRVKARQLDAVEIVDYRPHLKKHFRNLNLEWLREYFRVEAADERVLSNPNGRIIKDGGCILFARLEGEVVGTTALLKKETATFELSKMAVTGRFRGRQVGRKLAEAAIERARHLGAATLVLETSPRLKAAVNLYRKLGFRTLNGKGTATYTRESIVMQLEITDREKRG